MDELSVVTWRVPRADARVLEAATLPEAGRIEELRALKAASGAQELVYLPTCQRVAYVLLHAAPDAAERIRAAYAKEGRALPEPETFRGRAAFHHLAETASSLDSLVVGEPQILGQVKEALHRSEEARLAGSGMRHVFSLLLRAAKAVRTETDLFRGKVSLIPLTEDILAEHLAGKREPSALVFGTGQIGARALQLIRQKAPDARVRLVSRDARRAEEAARAHGAEAATLAQVLAEPPQPVDVITLAMGADAPLLSAQRLAAHASQRPVLVLDLALPRNAEAPAAPVEGLRLVQLDELARLSDARKAAREGESVAARAVLDRELARIEEGYAMRRIHADLEALDARFRETMEARWKEAPPGVADAEARKWFEQTVRALLHEATASVKKVACERNRP